MNAFTERVRRAAWTYKQPLTQVPALAGAPLSDLFLWRKGPDWQTRFELTDMAGMYEASDNVVHGKTRIMLFDASGNHIGQAEFEPPRYRRQQIDISELVKDTKDCVGTFAVFHSHTPTAVQLLGSHLAERGYVSYQYHNAPLRAYVHGNLDAAALGEQQRLTLLAGCGPLSREYRLQHALLPGKRYDIGVVNPSPRSQTLLCDVFAVADGTRVDVLTAKLSAGACHLFSLQPSTETLRVVIRSRLVMARPLIFRFHDSTLDVLHG